MSAASKIEQLRDVVEVLECDGYALIETELKRRQQEGIDQACDVKLTQAERDAGAGKKVLAGEMLQFLPQLRKSLEATIRKNKPTSGNSRTQ